MQAKLNDTLPTSDVAGVSNTTGQDFATTAQFTHPNQGNPYDTPEGQIAFSQALDVLMPTLSPAEHERVYAFIGAAYRRDRDPEYRRVSDHIEKVGWVIEDGLSGKRSPREIAAFYSIPESVVTACLLAIQSISEPTESQITAAPSGTETSEMMDSAVDQLITDTEHQLLSVLHSFTIEEADSPWNLALDAAADTLYSLPELSPTLQYKTTNGRTAGVVGGLLFPDLVPTTGGMEDVQAFGGEVENALRIARVYLRACQQESGTAAGAACAIRALLTLAASVGERYLTDQMRLMDQIGDTTSESRSGRGDVTS